MDKFEYELKVEQIEKLIYRGDTITAKKIADGMEWKKEKDTKLLRKVAELYVEAGEYESALGLLRLAYNSSPRGIMILERMIDIALESENADLAEEFIDAYEKAAPESSELALYRYRLAVERKESAAELIKWLEDYTSKEMDEEYSYRLAELYEEINDRAECIRQCDYIIDFFCFGEYVDKAAELKEKFADLDEYQMRRMSNREEYEEEYRAYIKENDTKQKRQAREDAAEKQILEAQLMEQQEAQLGEQVNEIFEEQERQKDEINLDILVMEEMLQAEKSLKEQEELSTAEAEDEEETQEPENSDERKTIEGFSVQSDSDFDEEEDDEDFLEEEEESSAGGFWSGIKNKLKRQKSEEEERFEQVKEELEAELQETKNDFSFEKAEDISEEVAEETAEAVEEVAEEATELAEETSEEAAEAVEEAAEEAVEEVEEETEETQEPEVAEEVTEAVEEAAEEAVEEPEKTEADIAIEGFINKFEAAASASASAEEEDDDEEEEDGFSEYEEEAAPKKKREPRKKERPEFDEEEHAGLEAPDGNFIVACQDMKEGTKYAIEMIKRMERDIRFETIGKLTGRSFNRAKFSQLKDALNQDVILITGAGELTPSSADNLTGWLLAEENHFAILVDSSQHLAELEHRSPKLMKQFRKQYDYQAMSSDDWMNMIEELAKSQNVVLDESAYELYEKYLDEREERGEVVVGQDLEDALYTAIHRAERFSIGGLMAGILATKYDEEGMLIVKEKHFL